MTNAHSLWCKTCNYQRMDRAVSKRYCKKKCGYIEDEWCVTWKVGCASHSNIESIVLKEEQND